MYSLERSHCSHTGKNCFDTTLTRCTYPGKLRANSNPHKYEECVHGSWMIRDAPSGTVFNPSTGGFSQASGGGGGHYTRDASPSHQPTQSSDGFQYSDYDLDVSFI